jgi:myo-inositol-1-phosphate synthase
MAEKDIRLAIIGTGNCTSNLIQGLYYYKDVNDSTDPVPGIMHNSIGGYLIRNIKPVVAFDVHANKVGKDLSEAIWISPNNTVKIADVPELGVIVQKGPVLDGIGEYMSRVVPLDHKQIPVDIAKTLKENDVDVLLNFMPVPS